MQVPNVVKKIISWIIIMLSFLFLSATITLTVQRNYGPASVGVFFFLGSFALAQQIQAPMDEIRGRVKALMEYSLPMCPVCKSKKGYKVNGFWLWSLSAECNNCKIVWFSSDFSFPRPLKLLKIQTPPKDPELYTHFVSTAPLKIGRYYSIDLWKAYMQNQLIEFTSTGIVERIRAFFADQKKVVLFSTSFILVVFGWYLIPSNYFTGCLLLSCGISFFSSLFGFYFLSMDKKSAYVLFVTSFIPLLLGFITVRDTLYQIFHITV